MDSWKVGLISDTHGILRGEAKEALMGCELILHAGDIDKPQILKELNAIAPTTAVKGNMDFGSWTKNLKDIERITLGKWSILIVHNIDHLVSLRDDTNIVIFGHSHRFTQKVKDNVLYINPGSAGPRRFTLPITMAILHLSDKPIVEKIKISV